MRQRRARLIALAALGALAMAACGGDSDLEQPAATREAAPIPAAGPPPPGGAEVVVGIGWDVAPLARDHGLGVPYQLVGFACAKGLPPRATVLVRVSGSAGARPALGAEVGADGTVVVPFGLLRPGEVVWEFQSITLQDGMSYGQLPRGAAGTVGAEDQPCQF